MNQPFSSPVQVALDSAERKMRRFRSILWLLAAGLVGAGAYWSTATATTPIRDMFGRILIILVLLMSLVAIRLRYSIEQSTQTILKAIYLQRSHDRSQQ